MSRKSAFLPALMGLALLITAGCSDDGGPSVDDGDDPTATLSVGVVDNSFTPPANAIGAGQTVTWTWNGNNPHNVTFDDGALVASTTQTGGTFTTTFAAAGEFSYFCTVHGRSVMSGTVVVGTAAGDVATTTGSGY